MDEKDIERKMRDAWNAPVTEQPQAEKDGLWLEFATEAFPAKKKNRAWLYSTAAVLAVMLSVAAYFTLNTTTENILAYTIIENPASINKTIILPDSSVVELEPHAVIRYGDKFRENRKITLSGNAFFSVKKDKQHPFSVACGKTTTTVLGTSFTVNSSSQDRVQVNLYEGRVQMGVTGSNSNWILSPGEQFEYKDGKITLEAFNRFRDFDNVKLDAVVAYIQTAYGYEVTIPEGYLQNKITLRLSKKEKLHNVVNIIAQMYDLKPTIDEKLKKITLQ